MTISPPESGRKRDRIPVPAALLRDPVHLFALGFGSGLAPVAPGTFGSIVGLLFGLAVAPFGFWFALVVTIAVAVAGIWICGESARKLGVHDHSAIVWDEVAGMMLTLLAAPATWWGIGLKLDCSGCSTCGNPGRSGRLITECAGDWELCSTT